MSRLLFWNILNYWVDCFFKNWSVPSGHEGLCACIIPAAVQSYMYISTCRVWMDALDSASKSMHINHACARRSRSSVKLTQFLYRREQQHLARPSFFLQSTIFIWSHTIFIAMCCSCWVGKGRMVKFEQSYYLLSVSRLCLCKESPVQNCLMFSFPISFY